MVVLGSGWGAINFLRHLDPKLTSCKDMPSAACSTELLLQSVANVI